jgi:hypothetical protein
MTIIPSTWEPEIRKITVRGQLKKKVSETPHLKKQVKNDGAYV